MKIDPYLHAVLLLQGAGKELSTSNIEGVLKAAGVTPDEAKAKVLAEAVKGVSFEELLKAAARPVAAAAVAAPAAGEKKEEKKPEDNAKKEEAAAEGLASLFG